MTYLARRLSDISDRPVIDETGLKGDYDFDLTYSRELPLGVACIEKPNAIPFSFNSRVLLLVSASFEARYRNGISTSV
jgi:uncharacterized protein (TIGR03435 family)